MTDKAQNNWIESKWTLPKTEMDLFQIQLLDMGSLGCYENHDLDPQKEALKTDIELLAYFPDDANFKTLKTELEKLQSPSLKLTSIESIPQGDWATAWKQYFKPFFLTDDVVIRPSWEPYEPKGQEKIVTLDPGMAFGTGQHDTTKFCAELICEFKKDHPEIKSMIDVGCGSGILSIIAKKIGFESVIGFDTDAPAIETANENLERNPDAAPLLFFHSDGSLTDPRLKPTELVAANIIAEALCDLSKELISLVKDQGYLILSGIIPDREDMVKEAFSSLKLESQKLSKDWHAYLYRKS